MTWILPTRRGVPFFVGGRVSAAPEGVSARLSEASAFGGRMVVGRLASSLPEALLRRIPALAVGVREQLFPRPLRRQVRLLPAEG
jgi:hypothetical protein